MFQSRIRSGIEDRTLFHKERFKLSSLVYLSDVFLSFTTVQIMALGLELDEKLGLDVNHCMKSALDRRDANHCMKIALDRIGC